MTLALVPDPAAPLFAFLSSKGGVGKSTSALAVAHVLATGHGLRVALVDLDPQASLSDFAGVGPVADPLTAEPIVVHGVTLYRGGRALGAADVAALGAHLERIAGKTGKKTGTMTGEPDIAPDVIVADLSPSPLDAAHRAVLARPETLAVVVAKLDAGGVRAIRESVALAEARGRRYAILPTFAAPRSLPRSIATSLRAFYGDAVLGAALPEDARAAESPNVGEPVTAYAPRSRAALALVEQTRELVTRAGVLAAPEMGAAERPKAGRTATRGRR